MTHPTGSSRSVSSWIATSPSTSYPRLQRDQDVDVAIVGGGLTGLTAALLVTRAGLSVALVEKGRIAMSETGHTTGHIVEATDADYSNLLRDHGVDGARLNTEAIRASIDQIAALVAELGIDCGFHPVDGYLYAEETADCEYLDRQRECLERAGVVTERVSSVPLPFATAGGLRFRNQHVFHARQYLLALARAAVAKGAHIFENTLATDVEAARAGGRARVATESGGIRARSVLLATHVPINDRGALWAKMHTTRTYVVAGRIGRDRIPDALYWDTPYPYHYTRLFEHEGELSVIVGGEDRDVGKDGNDGERYQALESYCREKLGVTQFLHRWSGQINEPADAIPFIGESSHGAQVWMATGYSGTGITYGTLGGMLLADFALGRENRFAELYDPGRTHARPVLRNLVTKVTEIPKQMFEKVAHLDVEAHSVDEVGEGEGKIVSVDGRKLAVSRLGGELRELAAKCTHMGCTVSWNAAEQSWDCSCHGSRFSADGEVLNGPATTALEPTETVSQSRTDRESERRGAGRHPHPRA